MDIDEGLAQRIRETLFDLAEFADISERKMFGGLVTMVNGHMTCGLSGRKDRQDGGIMLRVGANHYQAALLDPQLSSVTAHKHSSMGRRSRLILTSWY